MHFEKLAIHGSLLFHNDVYEDTRGILTESYNLKMKNFKLQFYPRQYRIIQKKILLEACIIKLIHMIKKN